jgi:metal transporter CNNM
MFLFLLFNVVLAGKSEDVTFLDYSYSFILSLFLSVFAGIMSGLTIGLMGVDQVALKLKLESGTSTEKIQAERVLPLLQDHHKLLVTLLLANAMALETLPLVIDSVMGEIPAVIFSVLLTIAFSEIIPQALCIGEYRIVIASFFAPLVKVLMIVLLPFSYPIAKVLDKVVGEHEEPLLDNEQLKTFFSIILNENAEDRISEGQVSIIHKAIDLKTCTVDKIMTPRHNVLAFEYNQNIDDDVIKSLKKRGLRRIPILEKGKVKGIVLLKDLIIAKDNFKEVKIRKCLFFQRDLDIFRALYLFIESGCQLGIVSNENENDLLGVVDVKDVYKFLMTRDKPVANTQSISLSENGIDKKTSFFRRLANKFKRKNQFLQMKDIQLTERTGVDFGRDLLDD